MRVLLMQRTLDPPGGGNAVAAWMLTRFRPGTRSRPLTGGPWNAARVNAFYRTAIEASRETQIHPPHASRFSCERFADELLHIVESFHPAALASARAPTIA